MRFLRNAITLASAPPHATKAGGYAAVAPFTVTKTPRWTSWDYRAAIREGYKGSSVVYTCIRRYQTTIAAIPWMTSEWVGPKRGETGGEWIPVDDHPLTELIENPNPYMSRGSFMSRRVGHLFLSGNTLIQMIGVGEGARKRPPVELVPLDPSLVHPVPDPAEYLSGYQLSGSLSGDKLSVDEVIHDMFEDPEDPWWGMSPLEAAARDIDTDSAAGRWNYHSMENRTVPDTIVSYGNPVSPEQHKQATESLAREFAGPGNARRIVVLGSSASVSKLGATAVEMDFIESRKFNREQLCSALWTPPVVAGFFDNATLANADASWKAYYEGSIIPVLDILRGGFKRKLVPLYQSQSRKIDLFYDVSAVEALQKSYAEKTKTAAEMWKASVPWQEINRRLEMDLLPWQGWDVSYIPSLSTPAGEGDDEGGGAL